MDTRTHNRLVDESRLDAEKALIEVTHQVGLEYAELSVTMRELLATVYIRGGIDVLRKLNVK